MQTPFPPRVNAILGVNSALNESSINSCKPPRSQSAVKEAFCSTLPPPMASNGKCAFPETSTAVPRQGPERSRVLTGMLSEPPLPLQITAPILGKGWTRAHIIRPHSLLTLENEAMLMKLLLWADIHGWQKGTFQKESRICSSGVFQLPAKARWPSAHVGTPMPARSL